MEQILSKLSKSVSTYPKIFNHSSGAKISKIVVISMFSVLSPVKSNHYCFISPDAAVDTHPIHESCAFSITCKISTVNF